MERLFEIISSLFFEENTNNCFRYPMIIAILSLFIIATFLFFSEGIIMFEENFLISMIFFALGFFLFIGSIIKVKNIYFLKK